MAAAEAVTSSRHRIAHMKEKATEHMEMNIDQASVHIRTGEIDNPKTYCHTCMKLGSAIDSAIAVNAFPSSSNQARLPLIVKEVYRLKTELLQPSLMLLMLPIKAACQIGWFPDGEKDGLLMIAKEVSYGLSDTDKMNIEPGNAHSIVSDIVSRFYPRMKVEHILTSFDVKAGYGIFVADFHLSLGTTPRHCQNLWLLVAQLDDMDTAACITSPMNVDFLINGSKVPNRTKNDMGEGPQLPSNITKLIKYGLNLMQVFGDFDGHYIIALAFMNSISSPDPSLLQDYLRPMSTGVNSDYDVSELSSRISLYCPVSRFRIKTPVKGHLCKHPQCFDYNYFIEVNSTKPTWRCPLCDNPVCYQDIRVDQDFLKILNEAANDVDDVIISEDGSWMVAEINRDTMVHATAIVTTPVVSLGQKQVNICTTNQARSTSVFTPSAVSLGQTQVDVCTTTQAKSTTMLAPPSGSPGQSRGVNDCTTNQAQSTAMFTPPAAVTKPVVSPHVNVSITNQAQSSIAFTPSAGSLDQPQVNVCTTTQAKSTMMITPPAGSPSQIRVNDCTTNQPQSTTMLAPPATLTKPAVSLGQTQLNVCTTKQTQSTIALTPSSVTLGQTQVDVCTTTQAKSSKMLTPPAGLPGQIQANDCTTSLTQSTTILTPPAASPGQTQVNVCTTKQEQSPTMFTPPAGSPGQTQVNGCTTNQAQSTTTFTPSAAVTKPAEYPGQSQVSTCTIPQAKGTTMLTPPATMFKPPTPGESQQASNISRVSPTRLREASGDAMPSGRMRGSLRGDKLQAARLQYLAPPQQPSRANEPWSRPPIPSLPSLFLKPLTPINSENVGNLK